MFLTISKQQIEELKRKNFFNSNFSFLNVGLSLFSDNKDYVEQFNGIYKNFVAETLAEETLVCYILDRSSLSEKSCVIIDTTAYQLPGGKEFIENAEMLIFHKIIDRIDGYLLLHAGVVSKKGNGYIIYAPSGFGKTTLVMELASRGYKFLSDECCPADMNNFYIKPFLRRIGVKSNSPFCNRLTYDRCYYVTSGDKYYADSYDMFPDSTGTECRAKYLIMLTNNMHEDTAHKEPGVFELLLFDDTKGIMDSIAHLQGVKIIERYVKDFYTGYKFSLPRDKMLAGMIQGIVKSHQNDIFFMATVKKAKADFNTTPVLSPMKKSDALFEILTNLVNRTPSSRFIEQCGGKSSAMLMKIGEFVKDITCYKLTTGKLNEMANLIDKLS